MFINATIFNQYIPAKTLEKSKGLPRSRISFSEIQDFDSTYYIAVKSVEPFKRKLNWFERFYWVIVIIQDKDNKQWYALANINSLSKRLGIDKNTIITTAKLSGDDVTELVNQRLQAMKPTPIVTVVTPKIVESTNTPTVQEAPHEPVPLIQEEKLNENLDTPKSKKVLTSATLNEADYEYFRKNFSVKDTNVSSLEEADVICFGETHTSFEHRIKELWLLNKLAHNGDSLYVEGGNSDDVFQEDLESQFGYPFFTEIKLKGWDCHDTLINYGKFIRKAMTFTKWLEAIFSTYEKGCLSDQEKIEAIKKMSSYFTEVWAHKKIERMQGYGIPLENNEHQDELVLSIPFFLKSLKDWETLAEQAKGEKLDALFIFSSYLIAMVFLVLERAKRDGTQFYHRNMSLAKQIADFDDVGKKMYLFAGKNHLFIKKKANILAHAKGVEEVYKVLKNKKYVILFPNRSSENIEHAKKKFQLSTLEKIGNFSTKFFSQLKSPQRIAWVSLGAVMAYAAATTDYFFYVAVPLILGTLGKIAVETYQSTLPHKEICTSVMEWIDANFKLMEKIDKKRELIDEAVSAEINDCFLPDGSLKPVIAS